jgi:amino acid transporter/nucleotide-binding universal stress UspA family protein
MTERRLRRELGLPAVLMLGITGTIAAEVFVLTGHVAGISGPASVLVLVLAGLLSASFALNYAELATTYPVTGGALTYVQKAYGNGLRAFLVGSLDSLSSAFYAALSAVGFAYSLRIFVPLIPIVPTALVIVLLFTVLNLFGVRTVGKAQLLLGGILLLMLGTYLVGSLAEPQGFRWDRFMPDGKFFVQDGLGANVAAMFATMALIFNAFVGFELIADDAEEVANPSRNIPIALLGSLLAITLIYVAITLVTLGTIPWPQLAGSEMALSDASARFWPGWGPALIGAAGIIATLTSVNTAMLSATREALTLSRLGLWPRFMTRLGRLRVPYMAILSIGGVVALTTIIGLVDTLSYISSAGYLFVMFWSGLAMILLRRQEPGIERPFRVPWFPLTAYVQIGTCVAVVAFAAPVALAFLAGVLVVLTAAYFARGPVERLIARHAEEPAPKRDRIVVAVANPDTADRLVELGAALAERVPGTVLEILTVTVNRRRDLRRAVNRLGEYFRQREKDLLAKLECTLRGRNIPYYMQVRVAKAVSDGIVREVREQGDVQLLIMGWPGLQPPEGLGEHPVTHVLQNALTNIAVLLERGTAKRGSILVPFGGGIHARLALRLAVEMADLRHTKVVALRCLCAGNGDQDPHDELLLAREGIETEFGFVPAHVAIKVATCPSVQQGILDELRSGTYQLVVMGAALARSLQTDLFGRLTDRVAELIPCSVLLVSRHEPAAITWARKRMKEVTETAAANGDARRA